MPPDATPSARTLPSERGSLSGLVHQRLRRSLMPAELAAHERLKVHDLARKMGASETTVREALFQLAHDGAIEIRPRHYIRVRRLSLKAYLDMRDIRMHIEPMAAERAMPHIDAAAIDRLAATLEALIAAEASGDWHTALQTNFEFHFSIYAKSGMPTLTGVLESLWIHLGPTLSQLYPDAPPTYLERHQHLYVLEAVRARSAESLRAAIRMDLIEGGRNLCEHLGEQESRSDAQISKSARA